MSDLFGCVVWYPRGTVSCANVRAGKTSFYVFYSELCTSLDDVIPTHDYGAIANEISSERSRSATVFLCVPP